MKVKKLSLYLAFALIPAAACAQSDYVTISGKVKPSHNGEVVMLVHSGPKGAVKDSTVVANGAFTIKSEVYTPEVAYIRLGKVQPANSLDIFISKGEISLLTADSLQYATVSGNKLAEDYVRLMATVRPLVKQRAQLTVQYQAIAAADRKGEEGKALVVKIMDVAKTGLNAIYDFIDHNPDSFVSLDFLEKVSGAAINYKNTMPHFEKLSNQLKNTEKGKAFNKKLMAAKSMMVGSKAKTFESLTPDGKKLGLQEVVATGKYTLIDFWASWCGPCRAENPNVVKAYTTYHDKGFNILSVSLDTKADAWKAAIAKDGMPWYHVSSLLGWKEPAAELYGVHAIPQNVLVDAKGVIIATNLRGEALINKLKQLM
ncbi:TlpA disulfide reductase family protein [Mucilaginibacter paludis]|uniref:Alkyl hydroperoxide reductase/ Thiol specific antioxidant/ Mal allergen n=1 Tax=Mucilaginibacter paludis DSM 18603 TaxID=714943 RepID=H1YC96_9SPHI|nr:TlpA disulfide reductase family protein [Mucilaginibacter paludis]EHQ30087.1 alkyl hydroperoxide reductase/ Thiol specific antioxidant/ Mal allergen [Mucilaginibacter paludis DSM 18603]